MNYEVIVKDRVKFIVIGAGSRGTAYANHILENKDLAQVVAVVEPNSVKRFKIAQLHGINNEFCFTDWNQIAKLGKIADAVVIATQDEMHLEPTLQFLNQGYHVLLEKPMAPSIDDCCRIYEAVQASNSMFAVCHVLRYTTYTTKLKEILDRGVIGDIVSIQHFEPVGYYHQAHSFVRGNWANSLLSSPMLLAKACHDIDWIRYIADSKCKSVSSFGNLMHFKQENAPAKSSSRCVNCECESECPYSAIKIYMKRAERGDFDWPVRIITDDLTVEGVRAAIETGPYGRCVYRCDNDVVDHQVVNMLFEDGKTASFTMTAFSKMEGRKTRIFGTKGYIEGDQDKIKIYDFLSDNSQEISTTPEDAGILGGHGGGDKGLMNSFIGAIASDDSTRILSGPLETLESHLIVFAAEKARLGNSVVDMSEFIKASLANVNSKMNISNVLCI